MRQNNIKKYKCSIMGGGILQYEIIDFLKGFSIVTIVIMHLMQIYMKGLPNVVLLCASAGGTGVHVFIFCSGFGLYLSRLKKPLGYGNFLKKRFGKVYLPYIIVILISAWIPYMYQGADRIKAVFSHVFLYKMFIPEYESSFGEQFWFVSTIIQFYLVFIIVCKIKEKLSPRKMLFLAVGLSLFWWIFVALIGKADIRVWNSFFLQYFWEFVLGMLTAEYLYRGNEITIPRGLLALTSIVGFLLFGIMAVRGGVFKLFNDIPALMGYLSLAVLFYTLCRDPIKKVVLWLSKISYEWYLVHILVFETVFYFLRSDSLTAEIPIALFALIISIAAAYGYGKLISFLPK